MNDVNISFLRACPSMVRSLAATQLTGVRIPLRAPVYKGVAQLVEPRSPKPKVGGSSLTIQTIV